MMVAPASVNGCGIDGRSVVGLDGKLVDRWLSCW